jgi:hypothetical protein
MSEQEYYLEVVRAEYLSGYRLRLAFNDGEVRLIDFEPFLRHARNPMIRKYLNLNLFQDFSIVYGDLVWHDYELCFPIADLYAGKIEHEARFDAEIEFAHTSNMAVYA